MMLYNVVVQFTVTIPELEVDKDLGIAAARLSILKAANHEFIRGNGPDSSQIIDVPNYPALRD